MISLSKARFCEFSHTGYGNSFFLDWLVKLYDNSFEPPYSVSVGIFSEVRFQLIMLCRDSVIKWSCKMCCVSWFEDDRSQSLLGYILSLYWELLQIILRSGVQLRRERLDTTWTGYVVIKCRYYVILKLPRFKAWQFQNYFFVWIEQFLNCLISSMISKVTQPVIAR